LKVDFKTVAPYKKTLIFRDMAVIGAVFILMALFIRLNWVIDFTIFAILVLSYDLLYGYMGRLSFGHVLYYGIGAYTASLFLIHVSPNPFGAIAAGIAVGAVVATIIGFIVVQTEGAPFALVNLAFNQIGYWLAASGLQSITRGEDGLPSSAEAIGFLDFSDKPTVFLFALICMLAVFLLLKVFTLSPYGVLVRSMKENEARVQFIGYDTFRYQWLTFVLSSSLAALPGTLYALFYGFVAPTVIIPFGNIEVIFAILIGGAGNLYGALVGAVAFKLISNILATNITRWEMFLGALLLVLVFKFRRGLTGYAADLLFRFRGKPTVEV
jgi:branched-chain amino acid transport system permease protein